MKVEIEVKQEIVNGVTGPKRYDIRCVIPYGTGAIHWQKDFYVLDLDADTVKELIEKLTSELTNALKV